MKNILIIIFAFVSVNAISQEMAKPDQLYNTQSLDVKPYYIGGLSKFYEYMNANLKVPTDIKGKVFVTFIVEKDGKLTDIKVIRDVKEGAGDEVIRVLKDSPTWSPGKLNGVAVRTLFSVPITLNQVPFTMPVKK